MGIIKLKMKSIALFAMLATLGAAAPPSCTFGGIHAEFFTDKKCTVPDAALTAKQGKPAQEAQAFFDFKCHSAANHGSSGNQSMKLECDDKFFTFAVWKNSGCKGKADNTD